MALLQSAGRLHSGFDWQSSVTSIFVRPLEPRRVVFGVFLLRLVCVLLTHMLCCSALRQLNNNQFSGFVPNSICNLQSLKQLDLSVNQLGGSIPDSIGNLQFLEFLDLSVNQLGGSIPDSIDNLQFLGTFFLNDNTLTGVVPSWVCNSYFSDSSYDLRGNLFSCPLPACCSSTGNGRCTPCFDPNSDGFPYVVVFGSLGLVAGVMLLLLIAYFVRKRYHQAELGGGHALGDPTVAGQGGNEREPLLA